MRNALSTVPKVAQQMVAATLRTIFAQPDLASAKETVERISRLFENRYPKLVEVLQEAENDILAYYGFPLEHRRQVWSTKSLERLNKEVSRRCDVVGIFPNRQSLLRLTGRCSRKKRSSECPPSSCGTGMRFGSNYRPSAYSPGSCARPSIRLQRNSHCPTRICRKGG